MNDHLKTKPELIEELESLRKSIAEETPGERKREDTLQRNENVRIKHIIETVGDPIFVKDNDHRITLANSAFLDVFGLNEKNVIGLTLAENVPAHERHQFLAIDRQVLDTGIPDLREETLTVNNFTRTIITRKNRFVTDTGEKFLVGSIHDITERKLAEEEIRSTRDYANNLIESSLDMIIAVDNKRKITEFNTSAEETFGYNRSEVIGKHVNLLYANPKEGLKVHKQTVLNGHHVQEILNKRKNGDIFPSLLSASILKDKDGNQMGVMGVSKDITEDKETEEKFRYYVSKIKGINEASHALTNSLDSKFVVNRCIDIAKEMFEANSVTLFILEKGGEYLKPLASNAKYIDKVMDFKLKVGEGLTGQVVQERNAKIVNRIDLTNIGKQVPGTPVEPESLMCAPLKIDHVAIGAILLSKYGEDEFWEDDLAFLVNLADLTAIAIQNSQLYEETMSANQVKDQFIANISHEIRTPLNSIVGFSDILKERYSETVSEKDQSIFGYITSSGNRLMHTVDSILNIAQLSAGTIKVQKRKLDLSSIIRAVVNELKDRSDEKNLDLIYLPSKEEAIIFADDYCVHQAILNLTDNAIKFTFEGQIELRLGHKNGQVKLSIIDSGIGISEDYKNRIFQPYTQESEGFTKNFQGIGLGLALTKQYLELNSIDLKLESKKGVGTTFTLMFQKYKRNDHV
ncbi:MAG: PAS domain S-box protein [Candidatus Marinimicrobia bacterium]|nr:PAS domain S-box protein [Candidatus Neomarinimicrobiota bacterium]